VGPSFKGLKKSGRSRPPTHVPEGPYCSYLMIVISSETFNAGMHAACFSFSFAAIFFSIHIINGSV